MLKVRSEDEKYALKALLSWETKTSFVYDKAIENWGYDVQTTVAIEEMSELTKELCKVLRGDKRDKALLEELADVQIMLEQMIQLYDTENEVLEIRQKKLECLRKKLIDSIVVVKEG